MMEESASAKVIVLKETCEFAAKPFPDNITCLLGSNSESETASGNESKHDISSSSEGPHVESMSPYFLGRERRKRKPKPIDSDFWYFGDEKKFVITEEPLTNKVVKVQRTKPKTDKYSWITQGPKLQVNLERLSPKVITSFCGPGYLQGLAQHNPKVKSLCKPKCKSHPTKAVKESSKVEPHQKKPKVIRIMCDGKMTVVKPLSMRGSKCEDLAVSDQAPAAKTKSLLAGMQLSEQIKPPSRKKDSKNSLGMDNLLKNQNLCSSKHSLKIKKNPKGKSICTENNNVLPNRILSKRPVKQRRDLDYEYDLSDHDSVFSDKGSVSVDEKVNFSRISASIKTQGLIDSPASDLDFQRNNSVSADSDEYFEEGSLNETFPEVGCSPAESETNETICESHSTPASLPSQCSGLDAVDGNPVDQKFVLCVNKEVNELMYVSCDLLDNLPESIKPVQESECNQDNDKEILIDLRSDRDNHDDTESTDDCATLNDLLVTSDKEMSPVCCSPELDSASPVAPSCISDHSVSTVSSATGKLNNFSVISDPCSLSSNSMVKTEPLLPKKPLESPSHVTLCSDTSRQAEYVSTLNNAQTVAMADADEVGEDILMPTSPLSEKASKHCVVLKASLPSSHGNVSSLSQPVKETSPSSVKIILSPDKKKTAAKEAFTSSTGSHVKLVDSSTKVFSPVTKKISSKSSVVKWHHAPTNSGKPYPKAGGKVTILQPTKSFYPSPVAVSSINQNPAGKNTSRKMANSPTAQIKSSSHVSAKNKLVLPPSSLAEKLQELTEADSQPCQEGNKPFRIIVFPNKKESKGGNAQEVTLNIGGCSDSKKEPLKQETINSRLKFTLVPSKQETLICPSVQQEKLSAKKKPLPCNTKSASTVNKREGMESFSRGQSILKSVHSPMVSHTESKTAFELLSEVGRCSDSRCDASNDNDDELMTDDSSTEPCDFSDVDLVSRVLFS